jgi:hypothetical protein
MSNSSQEPQSNNKSNSSGSIGCFSLLCLFVSLCFVWGIGLLVGILIDEAMLESLLGSIGIDINKSLVSVDKETYAKLMDDQQKLEELRIDFAILKQQEQQCNEQLTSCQTTQETITSSDNNTPSPTPQEPEKIDLGIKVPVIIPLEIICEKMD